MFQEFTALYATGSEEDEIMIHINEENADLERVYCYADSMPAVVKGRTYPTKNPLFVNIPFVFWDDVLKHVVFSNEDLLNPLLAEAIKSNPVLFKR